jgi:hemerythrin-like domain-containing protein
MAPFFDPTDKQYQLHAEFPPNKESTWKYPAEKDGWCCAHRALMGEIRIFTEAFESLKWRGNELVDWEITSIQTAFAGHLEHVTWHHSDEDDNVVPFLKKRFKYPAKLEAAHPEIEALSDKIKTAIEGLKAGDRIDPILAAWKEYGGIIVPHMKEEEEFALPLLRAYFTQDDLRPVIAYIIQHAPKIEMGSMAFFDVSDMYII